MNLFFTKPCNSTLKIVALSPESPCISYCDVSNVQIACSVRDEFFLPSGTEFFEALYPLLKFTPLHSALTISQINSFHNGYINLCPDYKIDK
jgi:hypothetical protein